PQTLRLLGEILREPAFPDSELNLKKQQMRQLLEQGRTDPATLANRALNEKLNPFPKDDIRYQPTLEEEFARVDALTADQVRKLYAEQLSAQAGEFAAVGEFDATSVVELLQQALKDWKTPVAYEHIARQAKMNVTGGRLDINTPDKANAVYNAGF